MTAPEKRAKGIHIGAPACFELELCCKHINEAFTGHFGCYVVGSVLERPDWRDVDVRLIMKDEAFAALFPDCHWEANAWESDPRWLLLTVALSRWLSAHTGLPVDFQFQPQSKANERYKGRRNAMGMRMAKRSEDEQ